ncbi:ABC transporter permease [Oceanobacillus piezotolerans]|uniref:ABC transporter permease n=1 Tax=Oceanobacillus piezotolerans TaxID=2448030 RepID=UPI0016572846|nr:ABC transporter permease [Oceanobacillus piezotolerans]
MGKVIASEFVKIKRKMIVFLVFLGPFGVVSLELVNFWLRYDWLTNLYKDNLWRGLIGEVMMLSIPSLMLGLTIVTSMIANIEHQTNAWKQVLALPVSKAKIFTGKLLLSGMLLFVSCMLLFGGTIILGILLKFGTDIPFLYVIKMCFFPLFSAMPFVALQIWLSIVCKNQAIPLMVGIVGTAVSMFSITFPDWVPWKWPLLINEWGNPIYSVIAGLILAMVVYAGGLLDFIRRDVK